MGRTPLSCARRADHGGRHRHPAAACLPARGRLRLGLPGSEFPRPGAGPGGRRALRVRRFLQPHPGPSGLPRRFRGVRGCQAAPVRVCKRSPGGDQCGRCVRPGAGRQPRWAGDPHRGPQPRGSFLEPGGLSRGGGERAPVEPLGNGGDAAARVRRIFPGQCRRGHRRTGGMRLCLSRPGGMGRHAQRRSRPHGVLPGTGPAHGGGGLRAHARCAGQCPVRPRFPLPRPADLRHRLRRQPGPGQAAADGARGGCGGGLGVADQRQPPLGGARGHRRGNARRAGRKRGRSRRGGPGRCHRRRHCRSGTRRPGGGSRQGARDQPGNSRLPAPLQRPRNRPPCTGPHPPPTSCCGHPGGALSGEREGVPLAERALSGEREGVQKEPSAGSARGHPSQKEPSAGSARGHPSQKEPSAGSARGHPSGALSGERKGAPLAERALSGERKGAPLAERALSGERKGAPLAERALSGERKGAPLAERALSGERKGAPLAERALSGEREGVPLAERVSAGERERAPLVDDSVGDGRAPGGRG